MLKHKISWLTVLFLSLVSTADAATYNYLLQVSGGTQSPQGTLGAYEVSWRSSSLLNPPPCPAGIDLSKQPGFQVIGTPVAGYSPLTAGAAWLFCANSGVPRMQTFWHDESNDQLAYFLGFGSNAPSTTGVFTPTDATQSEIANFIFPPIPGPPATLTITESVSGPPVPSWLGTVIRVSLTVAGPVTPLPGVPVEAMVGFIDIDGNPLGQTTTVPLVAGHVSSVDLNSAAFVTELGRHVDVIPVVSAPEGQLLPAVQMTVEVFDRLTGYGAVLTSVNGLAPPPATLAPQGLAAGQTMRLTATAWPPNPIYPPEPCNATLSFVNSEGVAIGPSVSVNLSPGQSQSLDLKSAALNVTLGHPMLVQPVVTLQPVIGAAVAAGPACMVSSDVFDTIAGRTWTYQTANVQ